MTLKAFFSIFVAGLLVGAALVGWFFESTIRRQNRLLDSTVEQIVVARDWDAKCQAALDTVWEKIDAGRAEQERRALGGD